MQTVRQWSDHTLYSPPDIIGMVTSRGWWVGNVACMHWMTHTTFWPETWREDTTWVLKDIESEVKDWAHMAQDRYQCPETSWRGWTTVSFSRKILLHGVSQFYPRNGTMLNFIGKFPLDIVHCPDEKLRRFDRNVVYIRSSKQRTMPKQNFPRWYLSLRTSAFLLGNPASTPGLRAA
jgi:hypothetical protein